jgi:ankyrin repeat protein
MHRIELLTPLHEASLSPLNAETVQLLIEHGADVHAQDQSHSDAFASGVVQRRLDPGIPKLRRYY